MEIRKRNIFFLAANAGSGIWFPVRKKNYLRGR